MSKNVPWWLNWPSEAQSFSTTSNTSAERARTPAGVAGSRPNSARSVGMAPPPMPHWNRPRAM